MAESCFSGNGMFDETAIRHGVYVTGAYIVLFYVFIICQVISHKRIYFAKRARGERFERYYNVQDRPVLGWDRIIGNYLEQAMPFLTTFWINVGLAAVGATNYRNIAVAGWVYVVFRALYPLCWFAGGGGRGGTRNKIVIATLAMYVVIVYLSANMFYAVHSR